MTDNKRKICLTSPENLSHLTKDCSNRAPKIYKTHSAMSISVADLQKIKTIIDSSLEEKLQSATSNLATKDDLKNLNAEINLLRQQNEDLSRKVQQFENRCCLLENEIEAQSRELKGKNIIMSIPNDVNTDPKLKVQEITQLLLGNECSNGFSLPVKISENNRIIKMKLNTGSTDTAARLLKNSFKLKGTGVFLQRDLSKQMQLKRRVLLEYRRILKTSKPTSRIQMKNNTLVIEGKSFYLNNNNNLIFNENDGELELQRMFGQLNFENVNKIMLSNTRQNNWTRSATSPSAPGMSLRTNEPSASYITRN